MGGVTPFLAVVISLMLTHMAVLAGTSLRLLPPELVVTEGETVKFTCTPVTPVALPILEINGSIIFTEPRLQIQHNPMYSADGNSTYTFSNVTRQDNGTTFRCILAGKVSNTVTMRVIVPPMISGRTGPYTILEGSSRTLIYEVIGDPFPHSLVWFYNGLPFTGNERITIVRNTTLTIRDASRHDSGNYTFVVTSSYEKQYSISLELLVAYNEFLMAPRNVTLMTGEIATQDCCHRFGRAYTWRVNGIHVNSRASKVAVTQFGRRLRYGPVDYSDHLLQIHCIVHLRDGQFFVSAPGILRVHTPPRVHAPENITVIEGHDIKLNFSVVADPPVSSLTFYHNGQPLSTNAAVSIHGGTSLIVRGSPRISTGTYTLMARNSLGSGSASIVLEVLFAPDIFPLRMSVVAQVNESISIPCGQEVSGNPAPNFVWQRQPPDGVSQGQLLDDRFSVLSTGDLLLGMTDYSDAGKYTCIASNSVGRRNTTINLLVLDPPTSPDSLQLLQAGTSWVQVGWEPPSDTGSLPLSSYWISIFPQSQSSRGSDTINSTYSDCTHASKDNRTHDDILTNSACVEVECEPTFVMVLSGITSTNVTGLIPGLEHLLVIAALSNGTNLQSSPNNAINFTTLTDVPSVGSVLASVQGPGTVEATWTLAYSGGLPVLYFELQFQKLNDTRWQSPGRNCDSIPRDSNFNDSTPDIESVSFATAHSRSWIVNGLESEELFIFRVRAVSELGEGEYAVSEPLLSHTVGVPSQPTQPTITAWGEQFAMINATIPKIGSSTNFSVTTILMLNGTEVERQTELRLDVTGNGTESVELQLVFSNLSYRGEWQFQVMASNFLGNSTYSLPSYSAQLGAGETSTPYSVAGLTTGALLGMVNLVVLTAVIIFCVHKARESCKQRRTLARRVEMAQASVMDVPLSPHSFNVGEYRYSPDGRSNTHGTPIEPLYESVRRQVPSIHPSNCSVTAM